MENSTGPVNPPTWRRVGLKDMSPSPALLEFETEENASKSDMAAFLPRWSNWTLILL